MKDVLIIFHKDYSSNNAYHIVNGEVFVSKNIHIDKLYKIKPKFKDSIVIVVLDEITPTKEWVLFDSVNFNFKYKFICTYLEEERYRRSTLNMNFEKLIKAVEIFDTDLEELNQIYLELKLGVKKYSVNETRFTSALLHLNDEYIEVG